MPASVDLRATPVVLMGLRGSGKSTLGRLLAAELGVGFADLDDVTAEVLGHPSAGAGLRAVGEPAFRDAEAEALTRVLPPGPGVLALGGGTPMSERSRSLLEGADVLLIYLRCTPEELMRRLRAEGGPDRPPLTGADTVDEVPAVFAVRDPLYRRLAQSVIECDRRAERAVLDRVQEVMRQR